MKLSPVPDIPMGWMMFYLGFSIVLLVLLVLVILIETIVLRRLKYGPFWRSLLASLAMNVVSTFLGYVVASSWSSIFLSESGRPDYYAGMSSYSTGVEIPRWFFLTSSSLFPDSRLPGALLFLLVSWLISVVSEGGVLMAMKRDVEPHRIWEMTLVANAASYVLLFGAYIATIWYL
jgi:hypothetical protein